jgi:predicted Zn-dependent protease
MPREGDAFLRADAADPAEISFVVAHAVGHQIAVDQMLALQDAHDGAVAARQIVEVVGGRKPAGARHVLHDDGRRTWNVAAEMARHHAGVPVIAAARR